MINTENERNVPEDVAKKMVDAYAKETFQYTPKSYSKAVWFPADQIIRMAEKLKEKGGDGLRIYFAQYVPGELEGVPTSYEGRNTVLLVPTYPKLEGTDGGQEDDIDDIENRGELCPENCNGVIL
ncbi:Rossmann-fold NAD(P)-binding domain-containing protein [Pedobacter rhizosphaerae]|uniref:Uncharacterized protein n=1 Tax=Pedobacter rhizosphaerae TaxID=390241 RepID=A0A1H9LKY3_9SPHI|nr:hypothetical protein [Pedobacter rhizosphaerae]SER12080.1 hypothetical protein SAMN04488023_104194 [Pedobacter rhizosphaerae]